MEDAIPPADNAQTIANALADAELIPYPADIDMYDREDEVSRVVDRMSKTRVIDDEAEEGEEEDDEDEDEEEVKDGKQEVDDEEVLRERESAVRREREAEEQKIREQQQRKQFEYIRAEIDRGLREMIPDPAKPFRPFTHNLGQQRPQQPPSPPTIGVKRSRDELYREGLSMKYQRTLDKPLCSHISPKGKVCMMTTDDRFCWMHENVDPEYLQMRAEMAKREKEARRAQTKRGKKMRDYREWSMQIKAQRAIDADYNAEASSVLSNLRDAGR